MRPTPLRWLAGLGLLYGLLWAALTWPMALSPNQVALGHPDSDVWKHLWGDAWFVRDAFTVWPVPLEPGLIGMPEGGLLYNLDPLTGFFAALLARWTGLVAAHNLGQVLSLWWGALTAALLARHLTGDRHAALAAGAVYGFSAHLLSISAASGIGETAHVGWLPLAVLALLKVQEGAGRGWVALGAVSLALSALGSWYYGLAAGLCAAAITTAGAGSGLWWARGRGVPLRTLVAIGAMAALALVMVAPFALAFRASMDPARALHDVGAAGVLPEDLRPDFNGAIVTLKDLVVPRQVRLSTSRDLLIFSNHPGILTLLLAGAALWRPSAIARVLAVGALVAVSVGLGPVVWLDRSTPLAPNPVFALFQGVLPFFDVVRNLERFQVPGTLCVSLLVAIGVRRLLGALPPGGAGRGVAGGLFAVLLVCDAALVSGLPLPLPTSSTAVAPFYANLGPGPERSGVIELPITDGPGGRPFWHQTFHGRPIPINLEGTLSPSVANNVLIRSLVTDEAYSMATEGAMARVTSAGALEEARQDLIRAGMRYITLSRAPSLISEQEHAELKQRLSLMFGAPVHSDPAYGLTVFDLVAPGQPP